MSIVEISREFGVADLPLPVRAKFAHALMSEREGHTAEAEEYLREAIKAEAECAK